MGHRRKAREYALQALYMYETVRTDVEELADLKWVDRDIPDDIREFSVSLIRGSLENLETIDGLIIRHSKNWKFERLSAVDKSILRISIYALLYVPDIPVIVTIDEGIELGKLYGGESSGQFINGILDAIKRTELKREDAHEREPNGKK
ncbi:MAG: transcription antitermination factor NusB [Spirochaetes bacterium]|nr:MAG: transcription antitermination factor NusB [Spirochaetota bacterium]